MRILIWGDSPLAGWLASRFHVQNMESVWLTSSANSSLTVHHNSVSTTTDSLSTVQTLDAAIEPMPDVIIMAMPAWQVNDSAFQLVQKISPKKYPKFICLAHGIGATEKLRNYFGEEKILRGVITAQCIWQNDEKTTIKIDGQLGVTIAEHALAKELSLLLTTDIWGGDVTRADDLSVAWSDVFYQLHGNALAALMDVDPQTIYDDPQLFAIEKQQIDEALRVMNAIHVDLIPLNGINIPRLALICRWLPSFLLKGYLQRQVKPSWLRAELKSEIGRSDAAYINGAVAATGNDATIRTPVNHALALNVTDLAEGRNRWDQFRGNIEYLETILRIMQRN